MDASDFRDKVCRDAVGLGPGRYEIFQNKSKFWSRRMWVILLIFLILIMLKPQI